MKKSLLVCFAIVVVLGWNHPMTYLTKLTQQMKEPQEPEVMPETYGYYGGSEDTEGQDMRPLGSADQEGRIERDDIYDAGDYGDNGEERNDEASFEEEK
ncbi:hypothetical protein HPB52_005697 [Rhipicephalus sanguineus]|uniref:Secreted protein n=1 Tax=Rhipicephalus sanguineus TaxID=34632 RepID=A0A9D4PHJ8_RHISA|nr:hypothetical protein HPB52_005697 [Rhipicephalus sanguineus]